MKPMVLYELRVLSGEQRGATSAVRPGDTVRIGQDWSNDVVLQGAGGGARLSLGADGALLLDADSSDCAVDGAALAAGEHVAVALYTPFAIGGTRMAVGRVGAPQWAALFGEAPAASADVAAPDTTLPLPSSVPAAGSRPRGWMRRLLMGGGALVGVSAGALTLAWAMGPGTLSLPEQEQNLRQTLNYLGFGGLNVERQNGKLVVTGHLDSQAQLTRLEKSLLGQTPARIGVWVNEQVVANVADVYRLNGISADVKSGGPGVVQVQTKEGDLDKLKGVQAKARRDVPGLFQLVASNDAPPPAPRPEIAINDPGKRVAAIVPGDPAYVVTADGTRYFEGAMLPTGHRILAILSDRVQIERDGQASTLNF